MRKKSKKVRRKAVRRPRAAAATKPFFQAETIRILHDDMLKSRCIPRNSVDLIVTSPPYNVDIAYSQHDDRTGYKEYLRFIGRSFERLFELARSGGRFCLNIALDKNKGGQQSICADVTTLAKRIGWKYHSTIIWNEQSISRRTAWGSWLSASAPYVIAPVEVILVLYKDEWKRGGGRERQSDIARDEFIAWTNGVWSFPGETKRKSIGHPSPFPVELPLRCIKLFSFVGDTVLDPFLGSGTTLLACLRTKRQGIGVDVDRKYCELARERIRNFIADSSNPLFDRAGVTVENGSQAELFEK
jgi:site-specific DNA-methyltransferase (adenine-specific)